MKGNEEIALIQDLILINQKKQKIRETLAFSRKAYEDYLVSERRRRIRLWVISLSSAAAIFLLGLVVMPSFFALDGASEFQLFYSKFETDLATRDSGPRDQVIQVISLYSTGQHKEALFLADSMLQMQPDNTKLLFFKGLAEMELNRADQAMAIFTQTISQGGPVEAYSRWYLALIYLKNNNFTACREQLAALKNSDGHPYKKQVTELYRKMRFRRNP